MRAVVLVTLMACGAAPLPPVVTERVVTVTVKAPCADGAPPVFTHVPRPTVCQSNKICYEAVDAGALWSNVEALKSWVKTTWDLCAPAK